MGRQFSGFSYRSLSFCYIQLRYPERVRQLRFAVTPSREADIYPFAAFTATEAQNLPERYTAGQQIAFKLIGNMTINGVTITASFTAKEGVAQ